jgi:hypothetical protein
MFLPVIAMQCCIIGAGSTRLSSWPRSILVYLCFASLLALAVLKSFDRPDYRAGIEVAGQWWDENKKLRVHFSTAERFTFSNRHPRLYRDGPGVFIATDKVNCRHTAAQIKVDATILRQVIVPQQEPAIIGWMRRNGRLASTQRDAVCLFRVP